ncbi:MAG: hypothetical protein U1A78_10145 [Polyangia bacterium]
MRKTLVPWLLAGGVSVLFAAGATDRLSVPRTASAAPPAAAAAAPAAAPAPASDAPAKTATAAPAGPAIERRLHVASAEASSFLWDDFNKFQQNYHPLYIGDDDPKTAWVEGKKGHGDGEWLLLKFSPMEGASKVRVLIRNGYQKTDRLFALNDRLKDVTLKLLPSGKSVTTTLKDEKGFQEVVLSQPPGPFESVELRVGSVYPGSKWDDTTVSDIQVFVTATTRENPAFEKARLEKLLKWKQERAQLASAFKDTVKQQMPVLPQYTLTSKEVKVTDDPTATAPGCKKHEYSFYCRAPRVLAGAQQHGLGSEPSRALAQRLARSRFAELVPVRVALTDKRPFPTTDGLCMHDLNFCAEGCAQGVELPQVNALGLLNTAGFNTFEDRDQPPLDKALAAKPAVCQKPDSGKAFYYAFREKNAEGRDTVRGLFVVRCGGIESREGEEATAYGQLLVYNGDGQLDLLVTEGKVTEFGFSDRGGKKVLTAARQLEDDRLHILAEPTQVASSGAGPASGPASAP